MKKNISKYIDYTLLKQDATKDSIVSLCADARKNNFKSVCVNPCYVSLAKSLLTKTDVKVCTVVGFPLGATDKKVKIFETEVSIQNGADEIDMVMNIGALKNKDYQTVKDDISGVLSVCSSKKVILKVIIEACLLTNEEKEIVSKIILDLGADFVKTSTGFSTSGATLDDIKLIKKVLGMKAKIKASGGIKDYQTACDMIDAGAERIGTSKIITNE